MPKRKPNADEAKEQAVELIAGLVDAFCREQVNEEFADLCRRPTEKLARKRPSPLVSGNQRRKNSCRENPLTNPRKRRAERFVEGNFSAEAATDDDRHDGSRRRAADAGRGAAKRKGSKGCQGVVFRFRRHS